VGARQQRWDAAAAVWRRAQASRQRQRARGGSDAVSAAGGGGQQRGQRRVLPRLARGSSGARRGGSMAQGAGVCCAVD
jgi:hypothetical protein